MWWEGEVTRSLFMPGFQYKEGFLTKVYSAVRKRRETKAEGVGALRVKKDRTGGESFDGGVAWEWWRYASPEESLD